MNEIIFAGVAVGFGCLFSKRTPASLIHRGCVYARALWLLAATMAEGAWVRRTRWSECLDAAWRHR